MFEKMIGKRVILFTLKEMTLNYVGTLVAGKDSLIELEDVTPQRETRKLADMVVNLASPAYTNLEVVTDPRDDPSHMPK